MPRLAPMRWPASWTDPSTLSLLRDAGINCLLIDPRPEFQAVAGRATREGLQVFGLSSPPRGVEMIGGLWPQVRLSASGSLDDSATGPTGVPWVDSNGWKIRLASALHPESEAWVAAAAPANSPASAYLIAIADAAISGGRWIVSLDEGLAKEIAAQKPEALKIWEAIRQATRFFAGHQIWAAYVPTALLGIVSDFSGDNEFLSGEILNLVARSNQQYRIIPKSGLAESSLKGLRAVLYADEQPPTPELRKPILAFVEAGGLLITGSQWGALPGTADSSKEYPPYTFRTLGRGRIAVSNAKMDDAYSIANDTTLLISHRYDLLRLFNPGAAIFTLAVAPDGKRAAVQGIFYASARVIDGPTVRVMGRYRSAGMWTLDSPERRELKLVADKDAVELQLPRLTAYAGLELEA